MDNSETTEPQAGGFFYGWVIVGVVFLAQMFMVGFWTYAYPALVDPVGKDFGASTTEVQLGISVGGLVGAFVGPFLGPYADKWSARGLMVIGTVMLVAALLLMSAAPSVYLFAAAVAIVLNGANLLLGPITGSTLISRFFSASRGKALGVAATGTSIGGILMPLAIGSLIASVGWRGSLRVLAASVALLVLPAVVFGLRDHPSDLGLVPDGAAAPDAPAPPPPGPGWTSRQVASTAPFWLIGVSLGLLFMAYVGTLSNLHKYATELGVSPGRATGLITSIAIAGFLGKLIFGWAADQLGLRLSLWLAQLLAAVGIGLLSLEPSYGLMLLAAVFMGLAAGGMLPVWGAMVAAAYGVDSFGRVMGLMMPVMAVFTGPGPILAARSMDVTGSYSIAFQGFALAIGAAALCLLPLRLEGRDPRPPSG